MFCLSDFASCELVHLCATLCFYAFANAPFTLWLYRSKACLLWRREKFNCLTLDRFLTSISLLYINMNYTFLILCYKEVIEFWFSRKPEPLPCTVCFCKTAYLNFMKTVTCWWRWERSFCKLIYTPNCITFQSWHLSLYIVGVCDLFNITKLSWKWK